MDSPDTFDNLWTLIKEHLFQQMETPDTIDHLWTHNKEPHPPPSLS